MTGGFTMTAFYVAALLTAPLSLLLLGFYRRAVTRAMQEQAGVPAAKFPNPQLSDNMDHPGDELPVDVIDADTPIPLSRTRAALDTSATSRVIFVYLAAGILFTLIIVSAMHLTVGADLYFGWTLWWFVLDAWPLPLTAAIVRGSAGRELIRIWGGYGLALAAVSVVCLVIYDGMDVQFLFSNALTTILVGLPVVALLYRPVRAVAMLVFAFLLVMLSLTPPLGLAALRGFVSLAAGDGHWQLPARFLLSIVHTEGIVILIILIMVGITGLFAWWVLNRLGSAYLRKRLSDQSLLLDSLWAVVALSHIILLSTQGDPPASGVAWIMLPLMAFAAFFVTTRAGLRVLAEQRRRSDNAPVLLWLRVFALGKRGERLFRLLTPRWRRTGSMALITGPDLATGTVQPNQFLEYLARRIRMQFIVDDKDLERRLANLDLRPDPDGLYRINQFFCFADTWQCAIQRLSRQTDVVLMDLRGFSHENRGCLYELQTLRESVSPDRVLLLIDHTTDWPFLASTLHRIWTDPKYAAASSGGVTRCPRILRLKHSDSTEVDAIMTTIQNAILRGIRTGAPSAGF